MAGWYTARRLGWPTKAVIALVLLAVVLVAAVPAALVVGVIMMLLGHVVGGLALFGGAVLAAVAAVVIAGVTGVRHVRTLGSYPGHRIVHLGQNEYYYDDGKPLP